jgi:Nif-specific regulatory protein
LYADASDCGVSFDKEHLRLFTGISSIAALAISNVRTLERLQLDNQRLIEEVDLRHDMVGESQAMRDVYRTVSRVAPMGTTVLITGESGTGKELVARAIHRNSARSARAFVPINCAAISEGLLESELFGHERGAFTGAFTAKKGKFEVADGGTLFLDEIGDMAPGLQAKLLRVLQDQRVDRVGGVRPVQVDVRIIAASNRNLEEAAAHGGFRQDLYFRLNTLTIRMPSLRERRDDIPLLARYFAVKAAERCNRKITGISEPAMALLAHYDWPGNVRELEHAIERAIILGVSDLILPEDLPECILESEPALAVLKNTYQGAVNEAKRQVISRALEQTHWVYTEAAKLLGVHPVYLHRLMRKMNLKSELKSVDFRPPSRQ